MLCSNPKEGSEVPFCQLKACSTGEICYTGPSL